MGTPTKKVAFYTLGCKLNFSETSTIARDFVKYGFEKVEFDSVADFYVINTCSVTENADKEAKKLIRKARLARLQGNIEEAEKLAKLLFKMYNFPKPLIAKVEGNAFGGGIGIISVCDIAVSLDNIKLALTEAKLGLIPATISPYVVLKVGSSNAIDMFTSARTFSPQEGQKIGLIKSFTSSDKIDDTVTNEILPFLKNAPAALSASKKLVRNLSVKIDENTIRFTVEALADVWENPEAIEGINAFFEKRKPNWLMEK